MDVFDAITTRRSVRRFTEEGIPDGVLDKVISLAQFAPSAGDARPWSFVVVDREAILDVAARINPFADAASRSGCGIVICGEVSKEKHKGFWVQDCAAATTTLLLAAHGEGLGAVWTGVYPVKERVDAWRKILALPKDVVPFALVLLGYRDGLESTRPDRASEERVFSNIYGHPRSS